MPERAAALMRPNDPMPGNPAAWMDEIGRAYADAQETIPFGRLTGQSIRSEDLFHLAPVICLKLRGMPRTKSLLRQATMAALSSYAAMQERHEPALDVPQMAFAFAYLAAHFGLDLLDETAVNEIMDYLEQNWIDLPDSGGNGRG